MYRTENEQELLFVCGGFESDLRTCHIHIFRIDSDVWKNYLFFVIISMNVAI